MEDNDVNIKINELKQIIRKTPPDLLQNTLYACVSNTCTLLTSFLQMKGAKGWSSRLIDSAGDPMLSKDDQEKIEKAFDSSPWILDFLESFQSKDSEMIQKGGASIPGVPDLSSSSGASFVGSVLDNPLTGDDVSLDAGFEKFLQKTTEIDEYWNTFAYNAPGVAKLIDRDIIVTIPFTPPIPVPVPLKPIIQFVVVILDSIRLSSALMGSKSQYLTLLIAIEEFLTGQWRQMILTAAGFISPSGVALGVIFKYLVNAWMLVNPTLRDTILKDLYKGSKSLFLGFLLWLASTLPPATVKLPLEEGFRKIRELVSDLDTKVKEIETQASVTLAPVGKKLKFRDLDLDILSKISLQDIQNLQALAQWKLITCSQEFDDILLPLSQNPIFRLILELLGVPVTPKDKFEACGAPPLKSISDVVKESFTPQIVDTGTSVFDVGLSSALPAPDLSSAPAAPEAEAEATAEAGGADLAKNKSPTNKNTTNSKKQSGGRKTPRKKTSKRRSRKLKL